MAHGNWFENFATQKVALTDGPFNDAFGRVRVSMPSHIFDAQMTYDLQSLLYEQITNGSGATITYDATNRCAGMAFSSTATGGKAYMQSFQYFPYQPGRSQQIFITFNFVEAVANCLKFAGYSDGVNGVELQQSGNTVQLVLYSSSTNGNQTVVKSSWNLDKMDGTGPSGLTLDLTKAQILVIDLQALYTGRVRIGFNIGGVLVPVHEFRHSNLIVYPYIAIASLPIRCGMTCSGTVSTTMRFICASVCSEGGEAAIPGYTFTQGAQSVAVASGARTHAISIQKKPTFNSIVNRSTVVMLEINVCNFGSNSLFWELCIGDAITGTTTFNDVNATYSGMQYNTAGTTSGSPAIVIESGFAASTKDSSGHMESTALSRYPFALDSSGAARLLGRYTLLLTGIGGTTTASASLNWKEIR